MDKKLEICFAETKFVLKHLSKEEKDKIPLGLRKFISENCDKEHEVDINNLSKRTYALLATIYRKYLAENKQALEEEHQLRLKHEKRRRIERKKAMQLKHYKSGT